MITGFEQTHTNSLSRTSCQERGNNVLVNGLSSALLSSQLKLQTAEVVWIDQPEPIIEQEFHTRRQQRNAAHDREAK